MKRVTYMVVLVALTHLLSLSHATEAFDREGRFDILRMAYQMRSMDIDADGRDEIIATTQGSSLWRVIEYEEASSYYRTTKTIYPPFPMRQNTSEIESGWADSFERGLLLDVGVLEPGGDPKVVVVGEDRNVYISDLHSGRVENVSAAAHGQYTNQILVRDLDGDGFAEILLVTDNGINRLSHTLTQIRRLHDVDVVGEYNVAFGNVDDDANLEMVDTEGDVYQFTGLDLEIEYSLQSVLATAGIDRVYVVDVDNDGRDEALLHYSTAGFAAYDVETGDQKWEILTTPIEQRQRAQVIGDADNDGAMDFIAGFDREGVLPAEVRAYDGESGILLWSVEATENAGQIVGLNTGDYDGDGSTEVVISEHRPVTGPDRQIIYDIDKAEIEWSHHQEFVPAGGIAIGDIDGDSNIDVTVVPYSQRGASTGTTAYQFDGDNLEHKWMSPPGWLGLDVYYGRGVEALEIGDVDGDGELEYVVGSGDGGDATVTVANATTMAVEYSATLVENATVPAIAIVDIDIDGEQEIIAVTGGLVFILNGSDGVIEWQSQPAPLPFGKADSVRVGNVDSDATLEIVVSAGRLHVIDFETGQILSTDDQGYLGIALTLPEPMGLDRIVVGHEDGRVEVVDGQDLSVLATAESCDKFVNAITPNTLDTGTPDTVLIACDSRLAELDPFLDVMTGISHPIGLGAGFRNTLVVYRASDGLQRIGVSHGMGFEVLKPKANLRPFSTPHLGSGPGLAFFAMHWRGVAHITVFETVGDFDGDEISLEVAPVPIDGTLVLPSELHPTQYDYTPNPAYPTQFISFVATDGIETSNIASIPVFLQNSLPRGMDRDIEIEQGMEERIYFGASDLDSDPLTIEIVTQPTKGTLIEVFEDDYLIYRANDDATGEDIIEYLVDDSYEQSGIFTFTFDIVEPAPAPPPPPPPPPPPDPPTQSGGGGGTMGFLWPLLLVVVLIHRQRHSATA